MFRMRSYCIAPQISPRPSTYQKLISLVQHAIAAAAAAAADAAAAAASGDCAANDIRAVAWFGGLGARVCLSLATGAPPCLCHQRGRGWDGGLVHTPKSALDAVTMEKLW